MDVGELETKRALHFLLHGVAADGHVAAHKQFDTGLQLVLFGHCLDEHIGQILIKIGCGQEEVQAQVVHLLHLEHIGIVAGRGVFKVVDLQNLACIAHLALKQGYVKSAAETTFAEVVLDKSSVHFVERERPASGFAGFGRQYIVGSYFKGSAGTVKEHIFGGNRQAFVAVGAKLQRLWHLYADFLDIEALPGVHIAVIRGFFLVVLGRELAHVG